jgi:hypothetical protein
LPLSRDDGWSVQSILRITATQQLESSAWSLSTYKEYSMCQRKWMTRDFRGWWPVRVARCREGTSLGRLALFTIYHPSSHRRKAHLQQLHHGRPKLEQVHLRTTEVRPLYNIHNPATPSNWRVSKSLRSRWIRRRLSRRIRCLFRLECPSSRRAPTVLPA